LRDALSVVFEEDVTIPEILTEPGVVEALQESVVDTTAFQEALATFRRAQEHLRNGRWAEYGREMEALERQLERLAVGERGEGAATGGGE